MDISLDFKATIKIDKRDFDEALKAIKASEVQLDNLVFNTEDSHTTIHFSDWDDAVNTVHALHSHVVKKSYLISRGSTQVHTTVVLARDASEAVDIAREQEHEYNWKYCSDLPDYMYFQSEGEA